MTESNARIINAHSSQINNNFGTRNHQQQKSESISTKGGQTTKRNPRKDRTEPNVDNYNTHGGQTTGRRNVGNMEIMTERKDLDLRFKSIGSIEGMISPDGKRIMSPNPNSPSLEQLNGPVLSHKVSMLNNVNKMNSTRTVTNNLNSLNREFKEGSNNFYTNQMTHAKNQPSSTRNHPGSGYNASGHQNSGKGYDANDRGAGKGHHNTAEKDHSMSGNNSTTARLLHNDLKKKTKNKKSSLERMWSLNRLNSLEDELINNGAKSAKQLVFSQFRVNKEDRNHTQGSNSKEDINIKPSKTDAKRPSRVNLNYHSLIGVSPGIVKNNEARATNFNSNGLSIRSLAGNERATSSSLERYQVQSRKSPIKKKASKESSFFKKNSNERNMNIKGEWSARIEPNPTLTSRGSNKINIYSLGGAWPSTTTNKAFADRGSNSKNPKNNLNHNLGYNSRRHGGVDSDIQRAKDHFILQQLKKSTSQTYLQKFLNQK
jgi:hypothetical protein